MKRNRVLSLKEKLLYGVAGLVFVLSALNLLTFGLLRGHLSKLSKMIDVTILANELNTLSGRATEGLPAEVEQYSIHPDAELRGRVRSSYENVKIHLAQLNQMIVDEDARIKLVEISNMFASSSEAFNEIVQKVGDGSRKDSGTPFSEINDLSTMIKESSALIKGAIEDLLETELKYDQQAKTVLSTQVDRSGVALSLIIVTTGIISFFVFFHTLVKKNILYPLAGMQDTMNRVATDASDIKLRVKIERDDEIGKLAEYFNKMADTLQKYKESLELQLRETLALNDKLKLAIEAAQKANEAKSVFLANISHELRTPMHGILSFARFGQQKIESAGKEKLKSYFDEIHESGSRLMTLLNDLLDLSKLEAGKTEYSLKMTDLVKVAESVVSEMAAFAEEKGLKLEIQSAAPECFGVFDEARVMQVLRNLLSNAIKFSSQGTTVRVALTQNGEFTGAIVSNSGVGIPEAELSSIFDKFVQSSKTRSGAGGTGLGLAICREIVRQQGGRIWAESPAQSETRFIFELPAAPSDNQGA